MNPYETFQTYLALKLHFTIDSNYDFQKYGGKLPPAIVQKLDEKNYKFDIIRISKHREPFNFLLANLLADSDFSPFKVRLDRELCERIYNNWLKRTQSLSYLFTQELEKLKPDFNANFIFEKGDAPYLLCRYLEHEISIETMTILFDLTSSFLYTGNKLRADKNPLASYIWLSKKYVPFLNYNQKKFRDLVLKKWGKIDDGRRENFQSCENSAAK